MFQQTKGRNMRLPGVFSRDLRRIIAFPRLFLTWWFMRDFFHGEVADLTFERLPEAMDASSVDRDILFDWVYCLFENTFSLEAISKPRAPVRILTAMSRKTEIYSDFADIHSHCASHSTNAS
ncbi:unnamed protein product [Periconia digitata]|uniref:Uncharacterized protein n=1 Tax=Periconia digitata TaxID=1303443 RepID=A0A9W4UBU9_9PLEO|nr:unnamed protein product [Periconia digitata]